MRNPYDFSVRVAQCGAIVSDEPNDVLHDLIGPEGDDSSSEYYGGRWFLCESVTGETAARIALCWELCRAIDNDTLRRFVEAIRAADTPNGDDS